MSLRLRAGQRLLLSYLLVLAVGGATLAVTITLVTPGAFDSAMGHRSGGGMAGMGEMMAGVVREAFREALQTGLLASLATAVLAAIVVSGAFAMQVSRRVGRLVAASHRIAQGGYGERVREDAGDELGDLARSFNDMAASLESTERRRLELVGDVVHELRTPLATLDGYLEGLEDGLISPNQATWQLLHGETERLTRLVDDLRDLWSAEAREMPISIEDVAIASFLADVQRRFEPAALARSLKLQVEAPSDVSARADRRRLAQVIDNLLANAIRYAPERSTVRLSAVAPHEQVVITVRDEGPGLTDEQRLRVFERFYRVDSSRSRAHGGAGIGLAIARAITELLGGRIWVESEGPGRGSAFHVSLPRTA